MSPAARAAPRRAILKNHSPPAQGRSGGGAHWPPSAGASAPHRRQRNAGALRRPRGRAPGPRTGSRGNTRARSASRPPRSRFRRCAAAGKALGKDPVGEPEKPIAPGWARIAGSGFRLLLQAHSSSMRQPGAIVPSNGARRWRRSNQPRARARPRRRLEPGARGRALPAPPPAAGAPRRRTCGCWTGRAQAARSPLLAAHRMARGAGESRAARRAWNANRAPPERGRNSRTAACRPIISCCTALGWIEV